MSSGKPQFLIPVPKWLLTYRILDDRHVSSHFPVVRYWVVPLSTWERSSEELVDRQYSPWDDETRRPSHLDRRNYLRRAIVAKEFNDALQWNAIPAKIMQALEKLMRIAA